MKVRLAKTAGFCFGVKRAVEEVYKVAGQEHVYTYGPIIHNEEVVKDLENKGVHVLETREDLEALRVGVVVIRSHGVPPETYDACRQLGLNVIDATCPFVQRIHEIALAESKKGRRVMIVGDPAHPECRQDCLDP